MARLTSKQLAELQQVRGQLERVIAYIMDDKTAIMRRFGAMDEIEVMKEAGSDLALLYDADERLAGFIERERNRK